MRGRGLQVGKRVTLGGQKEPASLCVAQATLQWLFTGAIPTPGLKRSGGLSLPSSWDYRRAPPRPAVAVPQRRSYSSAHR
uniref:Uncharacterized protein n=1 Tax=Phasianus colchicus TaxID=9054 RepID=A0A669PVB7_PHACC